MDEIVKQAITNVRAAFDDALWSMMKSTRRAALIYQEIRRLDLERALRRSGRVLAEANVEQSDLASGINFEHMIIQDKSGDMPGTDDIVHRAPEGNETRLPASRQINGLE